MGIKRRAMFNPKFKKIRPNRWEAGRKMKGLTETETEITEATTAPEVVEPILEKTPEPVVAEKPVEPVLEKKAPPKKRTRKTTAKKTTRTRKTRAKKD